MGDAQVGAAFAAGARRSEGATGGATRVRGSRHDAPAETHRRLEQAGGDVHVGVIGRDVWDGYVVRRGALFPAPRVPDEREVVRCRVRWVRARPVVISEHGEPEPGASRVRWQRVDAENHVFGVGADADGDEPVTGAWHWPVVAGPVGDVTWRHASSHRNRTIAQMQHAASTRPQSLTVMARAAFRVRC